MLSGTQHEGCGGTFSVSYTRKDVVCDRCGAVAPYRDRPGKTNKRIWAGPIGMDPHGPEPHPYRPRPRPKARSKVRPTALAITLMTVTILGLVWWSGFDPTDVGDIVFGGIEDLSEHGGAALDGISDIALDSIDGIAGGAGVALDGISEAARDAADMIDDSRPDISAAGGGHTTDTPESPPDNMETAMADPVVESVVEHVDDPPIDIQDTPPPSPFDRTIWPDDTTHDSVSNMEATASTAPSPEPESQQTRTELIEENVHTIVNQHREAAGLPPLVRDSKLDMIARSHSQDMADRNYYDHDTPEGLDPTDRADAAGYECIKDMYGGQYFNRHSYYMAGIAENIHSVYSEWYSNPTQMARLLMNGQGNQMGWMDSYGHRQNILHSDYDRIGIGVAFNDVGDVYATQNFC